MLLRLTNFKFLREGCSGNLWSVTRRADYRDFVLKSSKRDKNEPDQMSELRNNLKLTTYDVEGVVKLEDYFVHRHKEDILLLMLFEKMPMDCVDYLEKCDRLDEDIVRTIIRQVIQIVIEMYEKTQLVTTDMKLENVLIDPETLVVKLCDFETCFSTLFTYQKVKHCRGTEMYMSPEWIRGYIHTRKSIVWNIGVMTYSLLTHLLPFTEKWNGTQDVDELSYESSVSTKARRFVRCCLEPSLKLRPNIQQLLSDEFMISEQE